MKWNRVCVLQAPGFPRNICSGIWRWTTFLDRAESLYRIKEAKPGTTFSLFLWRACLGIFLSVHCSQVMSEWAKCISSKQSLGILCLSLLLGIIVLGKVDAVICCARAPYVLDHFHIIYLIYILLDLKR